MSVRLFFALVWLPSFCCAQQGGSISVGPRQLSTRQYFSITLRSEGKEIKSHGSFPSLPGFVKRNRSTSMQMQIGGGRRSVTHSITQHYLPKSEGKYRMPALKIRINDEVASHPAVDIIVQKATQSVPHKPSFSQGRSPFDQFFDMFEPPKEEDFVDVKADAFLALTTSKQEVFVGEGFTMKLAFYVSRSNRAALNFHQLSEQITDILNTIKPKGCWEESFMIQQIEPEPVQLQGQQYTRHVLARSVFYPIQLSDVHFPSVGLKMLKYKVSKSHSIWGRRTKPDYKTFYSRAKHVKVKPLPPHPLREQVAVGRYRITEEQKPRRLRTGQGFNYQFTISGEGNISATRAPLPIEDERLQFYSPQIQQQIHRSEGRVFGKKTFTYHILPQEAGTYPLSERLEWIYFDPSRVRYDTLQPRLVLEVEGESLHNLQVKNNQEDIFYLFQESATLCWLSGGQRHWATAVLLLVLAITLFVLFRRKGGLA